MTAEPVARARPSRLPRPRHDGRGDGRQPRPGRVRGHGLEPDARPRRGARRPRRDPGRLAGRRGHRRRHRGHLRLGHAGRRSRAVRPGRGRRGRRARTRSIIDCSTIAPSGSWDFAARLAERGLRMVDAPVSGGSEGARNATLTIFVGGDAADVERARPVLAAMGRTITHVGPIGAGQAVKAVNQVILAGTYLGVAEGIVLAIKAGLDVEQVVGALGGGAAQSWVLANRSGRMIDNDYPLGFKVALHRKDLGHRPRPGRPGRRGPAGQRAGRAARDRPHRRRPRRRRHVRPGPRDPSAVRPGLTERGDGSSASRSAAIRRSSAAGRLPVAAAIAPACSPAAQAAPDDPRPPRRGSDSRRRDPRQRGRRRAARARSDGRTSRRPAPPCSMRVADRTGVHWPADRPGGPPDRRHPARWTRTTGAEKGRSSRSSAICTAMDTGFGSLWAADCDARALVRDRPRNDRQGHLDLSP